MTLFTIIFSSILILLTLLCFYLPYKNDRKNIGLFVSVILGIIITWTLIGKLDFLIIFIWPIILAFQIIFITYWSFRLFGKKKLGIIISSILTIGVVLFVMEPWITDWTFSKEDTRKMLSWHNIELKKDFKILKNESGGFTDYVHSFTLKISESDFNKISNEIRNSQSFKRVFTDFQKDFPTADYNSYDTINYENERYLKREYYTKEKKEDGTYHFVIQLSKKKKELYYFGINE